MAVTIIKSSIIYASAIGMLVDKKPNHEDFHSKFWDARNAAMESSPETFNHDEWIFGKTNFGKAYDKLQIEFLNVHQPRIDVLKKAQDIAATFEAANAVTKIVMDEGVTHE